MTILESHRILIGACGWLHDNWQDTFYPEDLPQDWYLGYYANEFPVVQVGVNEWQQGGDVEEWLAETDELPVFVCEIPLQDFNEDFLAKADKYLTAASKMAERCIGIICRINNAVSEQELKELLQACQAIAPTVLAMEDMPATVQTLINELAINPLWDKPEADADSGGALYIARLDASKLPELRKSMENLLAKESDETQLVLLIGGEKPEAEFIKQAKVMLDLI
jgi:hypothetical protein